MAIPDPIREQPFERQLPNSAEAERAILGAVLLDKTDPSKVIARSREPLIRPEPAEREGYVPNVVYTCGAVVHDGELVVPYGFSDSGIAIAHVSMADLLGALLGQ